MPDESLLVISRQEVGLDCISSSPFPSDMLLPARLHFPEVPESSKSVPPTGNQVLKHVSLWETTTRKEPCIWTMELLNWNSEGLSRAQRERKGRGGGLGSRDTPIPPLPSSHPGLAVIYGAHYKGNMQSPCLVQTSLTISRWHQGELNPAFCSTRPR